MQCPNCGGFKVKVSKPLSSIEKVGLIMLWASIIVLTLGIGILVLIPWLISRRRSKGDLSWRCNCQLCNHKWQWTPGQPLPEVTVRPDLIAAGEKRLRKEEAHRQMLED
jgi:hypothetical protein